jgi:deazaflavin-dependent oxidoreductase (nitroreductase family)
MRRLIRRAVIATIIIGLALKVWLLLPNSWFYKNRRPTRLGRNTNRLMSWLASVGAPIQVTLETTGRRSGRAVSNVLVPVEVAGESYLVSMLGEASDWVRNVSASGGRAVIRHGRRTPVRLEAVPPEARAPILKAYLKRAPGARPHFEARHDSDLAAFERVAAEYPVFRVIAETDAGGSTSDA